MPLLQRMSEYTLWADAKVWEIVKGLTDDEFGRTLTENSGSIRNRYLHMAIGHSQWYNRWVGFNNEEIRPETLTRDAMFEYINRFNRLIANLIDDEAHNERSTSKSQSFGTLELEEMIFNILNHATYHRGQIVLLLRFLGKEVKPTDYIPYLLDRQSV
jgi:uncharacterized damage-inducible protein DinB